MFQNLFLVVVFTGLFSGILANIFGNKIGFSKICIFFSFFNFVSLFLLLKYLFLFATSHATIDIQLGTVVLFENYNITVSFIINFFVVIMIFVVTSVSFFVSLFSIWYMKGDPDYFKFLIYLNYFKFFMVLLVSSSNLIIMFVGWEGIGLFSYLLINFWKSRLNANRSAFKAIIINRVGDIFLIMSISFYLYKFENFEEFSKTIYLKFFNNSELIILNLNIYTVLAATLFVSSVAKSAQFLMHVWLPDAMEGPTPVSALLHAATMVTAGAYIIIKFNWLFYNVDFFKIFLFTGIVTNFLSSFIAIFSYDIKKVIAYSTASQMGLIFIALSFSTNLAFFHMFNHAFFKALLFILSGIVIYFSNNKQDFRFIKYFKTDKFFIFSSFLISILVLSGIPFLSAYYSKELIINSVYGNYKIDQIYVLIFLFISICTTLVYSTRMLFYLKNIENINSKHINYYYIHKFKPFFLKALVVILLLFSLFIGYLTFNVFFYFELYISNVKNFNLYPEKVKDIIKKYYISSIFFIFMIFYSFQVYYIYNIVINKYNLKFNKWFKIFKSVISKKFYFDDLYFYSINFFFKLRLFVKEEKYFLDNITFKYFKNKNILISVIKLENEPAFILMYLIFFLVNIIVLSLFPILFMFCFLLTYWMIEVLLKSTWI